MIPEWMIPIILWILVGVGAILAIWERIGLRKVLKQKSSRFQPGFGNVHWGARAPLGQGPRALHGDLDLEELHRYYDAI